MRNIFFCFCLTAITFATPISEAIAEAHERPNILFVMSDDHCARAIGAYQRRLASLNPTPTLDGLAAEGMRFDRVFCTNSICTPSRATILTGQYSHTNGVFDLYDTLPGDQHTLPREMKAAGYTTAAIGKWHLKASPNHFDYFAVIAGQGRYMNPTLHVSEGGELRTIRYDSTLSREVEVVDTDGHSSDVLTDLTLEWLDKKRDKTKPFFLMHHFKAPHDKFVYAPRYETYLADAHIPEPKNLYDQPGPNFGSVATRGVDDELVGVIGSSVSPSDTKRNLARHYRKQIEQDLGRTDLTKTEVTRETYQRYVREYLRCVKGIDDNLKRLLDYLETSGLAENTVVIYTSDQGMLLGEHDFIDKRWIYEESIRMPLIVRWPGVVSPGSTNDWLINNTDFAVTLLDIAGIAKPQEMQGDSFVDALKGEPQPEHWRKGTYYRYWMHMAHGHNNPAHFGIRTDRYKLIFFYGMDYTDVHNGKQVKGRDGNRYWKNTPAAWEFYDLLNDPHEMHNRYEDPAYRDVIDELKAQLKSEREAIGDTDAENPRIQQLIAEYWDR
ncbi:MAG: sulfatase [Planctomycetota bacterium]